eukprot:1156416-Pelagomonas_calceolata.AAC.2
MYPTVTRTGDVIVMYLTECRGCDMPYRHLYWGCGVALRECDMPSCILNWRNQVRRDTGWPGSSVPTPLQSCRLLT